MTISQTSFCAAILFALQVLSSGASAQEVGSYEAWNAFFDRTAEKYELYRDEDEKQPLALRPEPVYKWKAASADDNVYGSVYVWTYRGCPEVVACFWRSSRHMAHEVHSLSTVALNPLRSGHTPWRPTAGVPRQVVPGASAPADKPAARLAQMRRLSGAFTAYSQSETGERRELRVLSAPLYRYESSDPEVIDGGLFAFVCSVGTDPEAFLLLEARKTESGRRWHYAFARFSHLNLYASFEDERVWQLERGLHDNDDHNYYLIFDPLTVLTVTPEDDNHSDKKPGAAEKTGSRGTLGTKP